MRKNILSITTAVLFCVSALSGCQKAPEASDDQDIPHAQSVLEQQVSVIAGENAEGMPGQQPGGVYEGTIGTTDNRMSINAQIPAVPANVYQITLVPDDTLDMDVLTTLLDSSSGNIEDTSQELSAEIETSDYENTHGDEGSFYSKFGDHSAMRLTDGEKEASISGHTSGSYVDYHLRDTYFGNAQGTSMRIPADQTDTETGFSVKEAEQILLAKLKPLGITEVSFGRIEFMEDSKYSYYICDFAPCYEGMAIIGEIGGSYGFGEIYPNGYAVVTQEGVAVLNLSSFCGKIASKEPVTALSFEQIVEILGQYLDSNLIQADERLLLNNAKLEYFPVPNPAPKKGEIEYRSELELIPIWHIYMTTDDYVEGRYQGDGLDDALYNICINAVTGEIVRGN